MMRSVWGWRIPLLLIGWYGTMAYPLDDSAIQLILSVVVGTSGAVLIGSVCYGAGKEAR